MGTYAGVCVAGAFERLGLTDTEATSSSLLIGVARIISKGSQ
jgi:hypothetical protein